MSEGYVPLAQQLMLLVQQRVDVHGGPIPMDEIRQHTRGICKEWDEHHYYEMEQWFTKFEFGDGSSVVWGEDEGND